MVLHQLFLLHMVTDMELILCFLRVQRLHMKYHFLLTHLGTLDSRDLQQDLHPRYTLLVVGSPDATQAQAASGSDSSPSLLDSVRRGDASPIKISVQAYAHVRGIII